MTYCEEGKRSKVPKMIDMVSTDIRRSALLANKAKHKYGLFAKFSLLLIVVCEVANNPHIFLTRANQHIQEINRHFDVILNYYGTMVFAENKEQN